MIAPSALNRRELLRAVAIALSREVSAAEPISRLDDASATMSVTESGLVEMQSEVTTDDFSA